MRRMHPAELNPGRHPGARFGSARGVASVAPLPPPRPSPTRNASPAQNLGCVKVGVSQLRESSCLLTPLRRAPFREWVFPGDAGRGEALHEASRGVLVPVMPVPVLEAREDTGVEADQGEPVGVGR